MKLKHFNLLLVMGTCLFIMSGCGNKDDKQTDFADLNKIVPVSVSSVKRQDISNTRTYGGSLEGIKQSNVVAKISERIIAVNAKVGQYVKAGQIIIELEKSGLTSQYLQAQANLENTKRELDRMTALFTEGAVAKQAVDQAGTAYSVAKANFEAARSAVDLSSPVSGTVTEINVNPGDWVNPGTTLAVVADINQMIVNFNVSESEVAALKIGTPVRVYSEFNKEISQTGKITEINRSASLDSRSFGIKAQFSNIKDNFYKPGMFVKTDVILEKKEKVLTVPTQAVIRQSDSSLVYIIRNNLSFPIKVKTGFSNDEYTEILSGLNEGDTIVIAGMNNLSDSTKVNIVSR